MSNVTPVCDPAIVTVNVALTVPASPSLTVTSSIESVGVAVPEKVWPALTAPGVAGDGAAHVKSV
ncbi:hypothetical protein D3C83_60220 [compost metagenome]